MDVNETDNPRQQPDAHSSNSFLRRGTVFDLLVITLLWSLAVFIVRPSGEFPLNDDWTYSSTAKLLAAGKGYHPGGWNEATLVTHALWGALFCLPQGFSFTALRVSTLVLALGGGFAFYGLIRQLQRPRWLAFAGALTLVFNPIYFALSNTFMTDVPFTTWAVLSALFFVRHLQRETRADLLLATAFAVTATLCRQTGLCLPMAFGLTLWFKHGFQSRQLLRAVLPAVATVVILVGFQSWQKATGQSPANDIRSGRLFGVLSSPLRIPVNVVYYGWSMLMYLGWFLLPISLLLMPSRRSGVVAPPFLPGRIALFVLVVISAARFFFKPSLMPVHNNILIPQGIGPATLRDTFDLQLPHLPGLPAGFWLLVTMLSLAGAGILIFQIANLIADLSARGRFKDAGADVVAGTFLLLCAAVYLVPFLMSGFFDRYMLPVTAFLAAGMAALSAGRGFEIAWWQRFAMTVLIAGSGVFAVAGTRDYLEWNRTRWQASQALLGQGSVKPADVDGGFEFNGWNLVAQPERATNAAIRADYVIAFGAIDGYETIASHGYRNWMPPHDGQILVLKRKAGN